MPWLPAGYRSKARYLASAPMPVEWLGIDAAIRDGWNVMLVWDARRDEWRCDFIREGAIVSGRGLWIGAAADEAFEKLKAWGGRDG